MMIDDRGVDSVDKCIFLFVLRAVLFFSRVDVLCVRARKGVCGFVCVFFAVRRVWKTGSAMHRNMVCFFVLSTGSSDGLGVHALSDEF